MITGSTSTAMPNLVPTIPSTIRRGRGRRAFEHFSPSRLSGKSLFAEKLRSLLEDGVQPRLEFLFVALTNKEANFLERKLILKWGRLDLGTGPLTNRTDGRGGQEGRVVSEETRRRFSEVHRGRTHTATARAKIGAASVGNTHGLGHAHTPEAKARISVANLGKTLSPETRTKIGDATRGREKSPETLAKMSEALRGRTLTRETRAKMSAAKCRDRGRSVRSTNPLTGEVKTYQYVTAVATDGFTYPCVSACCNERRKTHGGLTWSYVEPTCPDDRGESQRGPCPQECDDLQQVG